MQRIIVFRFVTQLATRRVHRTLDPIALYAHDHTKEAQAWGIPRAEHLAALLGIELRPGRR